MKLTKKHKQEVVDHNIQQTKELINQAERANKGRYAHNINRDMLRIKDLLKKKSTKTFGSENFKDICKYKHDLAALLYMAEKKI